MGPEFQELDWVDAFPFPDTGRSHGVQGYGPACRGKVTGALSMGT